MHTSLLLQQYETDDYHYKVAIASADKLINMPLTERRSANANLLKRVVIEFMIIPLLFNHSLLFGTFNLTKSLFTKLKL